MLKLASSNKYLLSYSYYVLFVDESIIIHDSQERNDNTTNGILFYTTIKCLNFYMHTFTHLLLIKLIFFDTFILFFSLK